MMNKLLDKKTLEKVKEKISKGVLPQWAFANPSVYEAELEKIYAKTWNFLGHASEIVNPGDYVTRWIVHDPVLVLRDDHGDVQAYLNSCTHRGTMLCTADFGKKRVLPAPIMAGRLTSMEILSVSLRATKSMDKNWIKANGLYVKSQESQYTKA